MKIIVCTADVLASSKWSRWTLTLCIINTCGVCLAAEPRIDWSGIGSAPPPFSDATPYHGPYISSPIVHSYYVGGDHGRGRGPDTRARCSAAMYVCCFDAASPRTQKDRSLRCRPGRPRSRVGTSQAASLGAERICREQLRAKRKATDRKSWPRTRTRRRASARRRRSSDGCRCSTAGSLARRMQLAHAIPVQTMQPRTAGPLTFVARPHDETPRY